MAHHTEHNQKHNPEIRSLEGVPFAASDFVLQTLDAFGGRIEGKTLLQKRVYFVGVLTHALPRLDYRAHFYGPYSGTVDAALGRLCKLDFVSQTTQTVPVATNGLEVRRFAFDLTSDGREITSPDAGDESGFVLRSAIQGASKRINSAGVLDATALSIAAKTHFLLGQRGGSGRTSEVADMAREFNWNISEEQVNAASEFLQKLKLVEISNS